MTDTEGLRGSIQVRDEFLSITSHELKTPLSVLGLQLQLVKRSLKTNRENCVHKADQLLEAAVRQVQSLTRLIDDLLEASRIQSQDLKLDCGFTHLAALVCDVATQYSSHLAVARCQLDIDIDDTITGNWDNRRIEQLLVNLLSNAVKYAPGSSVRIRGRRYGGKASIVFEDNGPGIPVECHRRIFDRFERVAADKHVAGLGLGLYLVKRIVQAHHGTVALESSRGRGTRFVIELPCDGPGFAAGPSSRTGS